MSVRKLPDYRTKQKILHVNRASTDTLASYGDLYLAAGALADALEFYAKAANSAGLQKIKDLALQSGDVFLFTGAAKALNSHPGNAEWENIAQKAAKLGKYAFSRHALEKANNAELLSALAIEIKAQETRQVA